MSFLSWLQKKGLAEKTVDNYIHAIEHNVIVVLLKLVTSPNFDTAQIKNKKYFRNFCNKFDHSKTLFEMNETGHDMYRSAISHFIDYRASETLTPPKTQFPEGLLDWAGHRDGGVRRPFDEKSGRPTGRQIKTPLTVRLDTWVKNLVNGDSVPRVILLVGGPGNGKTDAVEGCIQSLDGELKACGKLFERFSAQFGNTRELPPRLAQVDLKELGTEIPNFLKTSISIVQDATERDDKQNKTPQELLLNDISAIAKEDYDSIYIGCVNRGILAKTLELAEKTQADQYIINVMHKIIEGVTLDANPIQCWPLEANSNLAIWPMDVESLVDKSLADEGHTVGHSIFEAALNKEFWKDPCPLQTRCPYCQNRELLERNDALDSIIDFLYYFELSSGKRWTFRDLFSLISYLLVGANSELEIKGKRYSPCQWAHIQLDYATNGEIGSVERDRAPYLLASRLYHHRLFPIWPSLTSGDHLEARRTFRPKSLDPGLRNSIGLLKFTSYSYKQTSTILGDIPKLISTKFSRHIDPGLMSNKLIINGNNEDPVSVIDLEDRFSLSIQAGFDLVRGLIHPLEEDVLSALAVAENSLGEHKRSGKTAKSAATLQSSLKRFASRLVKRSIGTATGICKNKELFESYSSIVSSDENAIRSARKGLKKILNGNSTRFQAELTTTFGQPVAQASKQVTLNLETSVNVRTVGTAEGEGYPKTYLPFLEVEGHFIPITFTLFEALIAIENGLSTSSLPSEVYSLLDRVQALVSGRVVRDSTVLSDDPIISLGNSNHVIELINGNFRYYDRSSA